MGGGEEDRKRWERERGEEEGEEGKKTIIINNYFYFVEGDSVNCISLSSVSTVPAHQHRLFALLPMRSLRHWLKSLEKESSTVLNRNIPSTDSKHVDTEHVLTLCCRETGRAVRMARTKQPRTSKLPRRHSS